MSKILYIIAILIFLPLQGRAGDRLIHVDFPSHVAVGEQFQIRYTIGTTDVKGFRLGNVPPGLEVVFGPSQSTQQSFSMVNGHTSQSSSVTYTYVLMADKGGLFVITPAKATVNGNAASSNAIKISVSGKANSAAGQSGRSGQSARPAIRRAGTSITSNDLFLRVSANKSRVYEQEPILLTYKVYTLVNLTQLEGKMPDLQGFHTQEIPLPQQKQFHVERVNGRAYNCVTWSEYVMFPQMTGKMTIPSITFKGIVAQENPNVDEFEAFFNGGSNYIEVKKNFTAPSINVEVLPLPAKPANFSGGVGRFTINANVDKKHVKAGDPVNVRFVVSGVGNMKLIKQPELKLPSDFDKYDAKVTDKTKLTVDGVTGSMIYDVLIVPRNKGSYTIPASQFVYFDTQENKYKTLNTPSFNIEVDKADGNSSVADFSKQNDNDIHDILTGESNIQNVDDTFFGSNSYMVVNALVVIIFIVLLVVFRQRAMELADTVAMRGKKANKVATKRLKKAAKLLAEGKSGEFYDEVMRALWGYVGDKLNIPAEQLSRDNISEKLNAKNVDEHIIKSFIEAIDECDYARYARFGQPVESTGDSVGNMRTTYDKAANAITNIDDAMKKKVKTPASSVLFIIIMLCSICANANANANANADAKANADAAYRTGEYNRAVMLYQDCKPSAEAYNNMGNAFFRMGDFTQAMLSYCKAQKLAPGNGDISHNIEICATKTADKLPVESDVFFVTWYKAIVCSLTIDTWALTALLSLIVALLLFLVYLFVDNNIIRHISFYGSAALTILFLVGNLFAWNQRYLITAQDKGVVIDNTLNVKSSPTQNSASSFIIHEGTVVNVTDADLKGWYKINLSDGREGWVKSSSITTI